MSENVVLRPWRLTDAPAVWEACQDATIRARLPVPDPYELAHAAHFITTVVPGIEALGGLACAIEAGGEVLGSITLRPTPDGAGRRARVGYWVAARARGRGLAPAALGALEVEFARYEHVELLTAEDNLASQAVAHKAGFLPVQRIAREELVGGGPALRFLRRTPPSLAPQLVDEPAGGEHYPGVPSELAPGARALALSFDDGPDPIHTPMLLDRLAERGACASFFLLGEAVSRHPELTRRIRDEGHAIGVHGMDHSPLVGGQRLDQVDECLDRLGSVGVRATLFRPPYGQLDAPLLERAESLGLHTWLWSVSGHDWSRPTPVALARHMLGHARAGSVLLLHDGRGDRSASVEAVGLMLEHIEEFALLD